MAYAETTSVSVERTRAEIETLLTRWGADQRSFASDDERGEAHINFRMNGRLIRFSLVIPRRGDRRFTHNRQGARSKAAADKAWDQAVRSRWRALLLCIKAKLEAVDSGIAHFEEEFLAHIVLPDNQTAGEWLRPQIAAAYDSNVAPRMLALPAP